MKKSILTTLIIMASTIFALAQPTQHYNYQGVLRNDDGTLAANENLNIVVSYNIESSAIVLYSESFTTVTNDFGEFNIALFDGTLESGNINDVNFIDNQNEMSITINGTDMGSTLIKTVPHAFYSEEAYHSEEADYAYTAGSIDNTTSSPQPNTLYANSGPLAYGTILGSALSTTIATDFGINTVTRVSDGEYEIVCDNSWVNRPVVLVTSYHGSSDTEICTYFAPANGNTLTIRIVNENNDPIDSFFSFIVYGTAQ